MHVHVHTHTHTHTFLHYVVENLHDGYPASKEVELCINVSNDGTYLPYGSSFSNLAKVVAVKKELQYSI